MSLLIYLSSGLFLGWSLGANDAANIFGTAVGSKMVRFKTAAIIASVFVILGAGISGAGATGTIEKLGAINEIAGAFIVTLSAGITVYWMTSLHLPVSTSQSIVGSIIGWNLFSGSLTDYNSLTKIVTTWVVSPVIAAVFSIVFYFAIKKIVNNLKIHLIKIDYYNRIAFLVVGAFGSYALGANNIANVMGVFVPVSPFTDLNFQFLNISSTEQLFIIGGIAIAVGIFTYSHKIMKTVGRGIVKLNPLAALIVVLSSSIVMFLFASQWLENRLDFYGLPVIPLVPVSSSQVIVGSVIGIGLVQGGRGLNFSLIRKIGAGWIITPVIACLITFISLFFLQNVFKQKVYEPVNYMITEDVVKKLNTLNIGIDPLNDMNNIKYKNAVIFKKILLNKIDLYNLNMSKEQIEKIVFYSKISKISIDFNKIDMKKYGSLFTKKQVNSLYNLHADSYNYLWQLSDALVLISDEWEFKPETLQNKKYNNNLMHKLNRLAKIMGAE